jgi:pimeloyl-ACP methyl ester carboxylesterase
MKIVLLFYRMYYRMLDRLAPQIAADGVFRIMSKPRLKKFRPFEMAVLEKAHQSRIPYKGFQLQCYEWGTRGGERVFIVHGWEGHTGNFGAVVDRLVEKGYHVIGFDAPAHGRSSKGRANMFIYADFISAMLKVYKPTRVISHSLGSVNSVRALRANPEISIDQWVLITTPMSFKEAVDDARRILGFSERTEKHLIHRIEQERSERYSEMNMPFYFERIPHVKEVLMVHSIDDKILPIESSRHLQERFPQTELIELNGLGHYRILWSEEVQELIDERF